MRLLNALLRWRRRDAEIEKELRFHVDRQIASHMAAGASRAEAERRTRLEFGGLRQTREGVRDVRAGAWLEDAVRDVQFALRTYRRLPAFALASILTLALGIGVNTALFSTVRQVLLKTLPVQRPQELVAIDCRSGPGATGGGGTCLQSYPAFRIVVERHEGLTGVFAFSPVPNGIVVSTSSGREVITGQLTSANTFSVLGVLPEIGRLLVDDDDRSGAGPVAVLSHAYWLRAFGGSRDVVGQSLRLNTLPVEIVGILPRDFRGVTFGEPYDVFLPLGLADQFRSGPPSPSGAPTNILDTPFMGWLTFMGRRSAGLSDVEIAARLQPVFRRSVEAMIAPVALDVRRQLKLNADDIRVSVRPAALGAASNMRRTLEPTLRVLSLVSVIVLLIACANFAGLTFAQALKRRREFGLRLALGADRSRLLRQAFTESLVLSAIGGGLGWLAAQWIAPAGFGLAVGETGLRAVDLGADRWMLAFATALSTFAGLAVGLGSVLRASAANPHEALRNIGHTGYPTLGKALLTLQIALTVTMVGAATLFLQTLTNFRRVELGFDPERLITLRMDPGLASFDRARTAQYLQNAAAALAAVPGVQALTYSSRAMGNGVGINLTLDVPGLTGRDEDASSGVASVGPGFARTLGLALLAGRDLVDTDRDGSERVAVVNESFATHFVGTADVVGRTFTFRGPGNEPITIVGLVRDARDRGVKQPSQPVMYLPFAQRAERTVTFTVRAGGNVASLPATLRRTLEGVDPAVGVEQVSSVKAQIDDTLRRERLLAALGASFGGLALLLVAVGLHGMLNGMVVRRTAEIGVRLALGAPRARIAWMVSLETFWVVSVGLLLGLAGYDVASRLVRSQLFGVAPADPISAAWAALALLAVAGMAVWMPVRRAIRIEPTEALREEVV